MLNRRQWLSNSGRLLALSAVASIMPTSASSLSPRSEMFFDISLAQWSMHRQLRAGQLKPLDFPIKTQKVFDIYAVEYVSQFFLGKANNRNFLTALKTRADDHGVQSLLIMVDAEGHLGAPDMAQRGRAVENHYKWVEAAKYLGCHSIRVNVAGVGSSVEVQKAGADSLTRLAGFARDFDINIIVENNKGYAANGKWMTDGPSANGKWLVDLLRDVGMPNCGALPDFGNFVDYDRYQGVRELMPYALGVSAKSLAFDMDGNETDTDFLKMLKIIKQAKYTGYIGIEYEGAGDEDAGILATKNLLIKYGQLLS